MEALKIYELWENADYTGALKDYVDFQSKLAQIMPPSTVPEKAESESDLPKFIMPTAVQKLGEEGYWPHAEKEKNAGEAGGCLLAKTTKLQTGGEHSGQVDFPKSLYLTSDNLLIYARDELAKIYRLIKKNEDYRSALLRAPACTKFCIARDCSFKSPRLHNEIPASSNRTAGFQIFIKLGM
jgi:hypothetical protein